MKKTYLITGFIVLLISGGSFAQEVVTTDQIKTDLINSSESLSVTLIVPDSDFYIGLVTDQLVENIYLNPCIGIKSDFKKNKKIIDLLEKHQLLDKLFINIDNHFGMPDSNKTFEPNEAILYMELFLGVNKSVSQIYVPIFKKERAELFLTDLKKIYGNKKCFKQLKKEIKT